MFPGQWRPGSMSVRGGVSRGEDAQVPGRTGGPALSLGSLEEEEGGVDGRRWEVERVEVTWVVM